MPTSSWKMYSKKTKDSYVQHVREVQYTQGHIVIDVRRPTCRI
jgi:hypothetical protein